MDEARISQLEQQLKALTERVERLEGRGAEVGPAAAVESPAAPAPTGAGESFGEGLGRAVPLAGRTFLVLGGAFAIRAITDSGAVPKGAGVALGLAFACVWYALAHRALAKKQTLSGVFHAVAGALIGFPLLVEATTRIGVLPTVAALAGVGAFGAVLLGLAFGHRLMSLAWVGELASLGAVVWLLAATSARLPASVVLLAIALATLALADARGWSGLRWPIALVTDVVLLRGVASSDPAEQVGAGPLVLAVVALYFGAFAVQTLRRRRAAGAFELLQTLALLALWSTRASRAGNALESALMLVVAAGALTLAVREARARAETTLDLLFYSSAGLVLVLLGCGLLGLGALPWVVLAVVDAAAGGRLRPGLLWTHAAILSVAAAMSSRLWELGVTGIWAPAERAAEAPGWLALVVLSLTIAAYALESPARPAPEGSSAPWWSRLPSLVLLALCVAGATGALGAGMALAGLSRDAAVLSLVRTAVLVGAAFGLAVAFRAARRRELSWLAYAVVALSGLKLLVQDLPQGRAVTLFAGFGLFGASLIFVPRLVRTPPAAAAH